MSFIDLHLNPSVAYEQPNMYKGYESQLQDKVSRNRAYWWATEL